MEEEEEPFPAQLVAQATSQVQLEFFADEVLE